MKRKTWKQTWQIVWKSLKKALKTAFDFLIDTIAPPDPEVRKIEMMSPEIFLEYAMRGEKLEESPGVLHFLPYRSAVVKTAIIEIKTHENRRIARLLGTLLHDFLLSELPDLEMFQNFTRPLVLPIPITRKKKRRRGWNQCELLAEAMKKIDAGKTMNGTINEIISGVKSGIIGKTMNGTNKTFEISADILQKIRENADQVGKSRAERFKNLENCFRVRNPAFVRDRNIIVFDDIVTTGATLAEAKRTLLSAGARKVILVALAH
ncbi:MAG TPA: phosphoribosyltransferase family protein [Candidatus Paceibacterota bacterium]